MNTLIPLIQKAAGWMKKDNEDQSTSPTTPLVASMVQDQGTFPA
jgi:hypothetical protein